MTRSRNRDMDSRPVSDDDSEESGSDKVQVQRPVSSKI